MHEQEHNRRIAEAICAEFAWNGQTYREGNYVALLDGKIIAVTNKPEDAILFCLSRIWKIAPRGLA